MLRKDCLLRKIFPLCRDDRVAGDLQLVAGLAGIPLLKLPVFRRFKPALREHELFALFDDDILHLPAAAGRVKGDGKGLRRMRRGRKDQYVQKDRRKADPRFFEEFHFVSPCR